MTWVTPSSRNFKLPSEDIAFIMYHCVAQENMLKLEMANNQHFAGLFCHKLLPFPSDNIDIILVFTLG